MTKFRDYSVEDTIESVVRALARAEPYNSIREGADSRRSSASSTPEQGSAVEGHDATREDESTDLSTRRP